MKINDNKNWGYVEGDTFLHRLRPQGKIILSLFLLLGSGVGNGWSLALVFLLSLLAVVVAAVPLRRVLHFIKRMAWFFLAIAIFPVLFTPGFFIEFPSWFPISISGEGLILGLESSMRLLNILLISLVMARTTSSEDWIKGMEKLLGPMSQRFPAVRDLFAVAVLSVKFLPLVVVETEKHFSSLHKDNSEWGYQKTRSIIHSVMQFIAGIFSDVDRYQQAATMPEGQ